MAAKVGGDNKLYRNTGTYGTPTWDLVDIVRDLTLNMTKGRASCASRQSRFHGKKGALKEITLDFDLLTDAAVADYDIIRDAWMNDTVIDVAVANGLIATTGTKYFRMDVEIFDFNEGQPLQEATTTAVQAELAYSSNTPAWATVP